VAPCRRVASKDLAGADGRGHELDAASAGSCDIGVDGHQSTTRCTSHFVRLTAWARRVGGGHAICLLQIGECAFPGFDHVLVVLEIADNLVIVD
jgi:hypothetical protein